ncbi:MAG: sodium:proton antiporter [Bacteroidetes bacterium]|nr:sodium:proton antiporter [Bacteroidota bacterium]
MEILTNPITLSVLVMCVLCLFKVNVMFSLLLSAIVAGVVGGVEIGETFSILVGGMGGNAETALSYILLGTFAAALAHIGISDAFARKIATMVKGRKIVLFVVLIVCAVLSQTLVPVHIAFIPILIPPLLVVMNKMQLDRRSAACALAYGLKAPYIALPIGFGLLFQGLISDSMTQNGMSVEPLEVWHSTWILGIGMTVGMIASLFYFSKKRQYKDVVITAPVTTIEHVSKTSKRTNIVSILSIFATLFFQLSFSSMPIGAIAGILVLIIGGALKINDFDKVIADGIKLMGLIAFVMLIASGYGAVIKSTGAVDTLISATLPYLGDNKLISATIMILIGLLTTMGIGTSFGTVPILAVIYVPMAQKLGFSTEATIVLIAAAAALGDAGSPASDTTMGPTSGLNADNQHNHIWDTCVPTFLFYNIPLIIFGILGALFF